jgi:ribosome modulation factor
MKTEAYYQGMRARLSELYKLGFQNNNPYQTNSDEHLSWLCGWYEAKSSMESINYNLSKLNESGIKIKLEIEK